jgi:drug/metabolite transporter (DMT)-like permease
MSGPMGWGVAAAVAASLLYSLAIVLQKREVDRVGVGGLRILGPLVRRPLWLLAIAIQTVGLAAHSFALLRAPVAVVEPVVAGGLAFVVLFALLLLRERPGVRELGGMALLAVGIGLLVSRFGGAPPLREVSPQDLGLAAGAALAVTGGLVLWAVRSLEPLGGTALLAGAAAGVGQGMSDAMNRLASAWLAPHTGWVPPASMGLAAAGLVVFFGILGLLISQNALRRYRANAVVPCIVAAQVIVPIAVAVTVFGETPPNAPLDLAAAAILTFAGLGTLSTSRAVTSTLADGPR